MRARGEAKKLNVDLHAYSMGADHFHGRHEETDEDSSVNVGKTDDGRKYIGLYAGARARNVEPS